jgi:hypothetical protein
MNRLEEIAERQVPHCVGPSSYGELTLLNWVCE